MSYWQDGDVVAILTDDNGSRYSLKRDFSMERDDGERIHAIAKLTEEMVLKKLQKNQARILQPFFTTDGKLIAP